MDEKDLIRQVVYCGPNLPKYGITQYQVYLGGYPVNLKEAIAVCPEIEKLIVGIDELEKTRRNIKIKGTIEQLRYERICGRMGINYAFTW